MRGQKQSSLGKEDSESNDTEKKKKAAAAHTYDYFKDKWDKFDAVYILVSRLCWFMCNFVSGFSMCKGLRN